MTNINQYTVKNNTSPAVSKTRILLVEDDEDDFILALDYLHELTHLDLEVTRAKSAVEAIALIEQHQYDLCLLDYQLGSVNGLEVLRQAQEMGFTSPIIMLTGQSNTKLDQQALDAGAEDYLIKSELNSGRFARAIRYALARKDVEVERLERLKAQAENESKNRFLAHLSHELRTPLTAILGYTELLLSGKFGDTAGEELDVILRNGRHLLNLLNDVLDLSKIAADKLEINYTEVSVNSLVADVYALFRVACLDKGLSLKLQSTVPIPLFIRSDTTRIRQILINIVNNAIKFTDKGVIEICLRTEKVSDMEMLCFDIKDTGIGIPQDKIQTIFNPFTQIADVVSKSLGGSGLGLAISSELVSRMGGDIEVKSVLGVGSCFTVRIDPGDISNIERDFIEFVPHHPQRNNQSVLRLSGKVLVVDDLRDIRRLVGHIVERTGAEVHFADNGLVAVKAIEQSIEEQVPFDLVLMDIHMPEMDGREATKILRERAFDVPIFALTAASMRGSRDQLKSIGFDGMLTKPVDKELVNALLTKYLAINHVSVSDAKHHVSRLPVSDLTESIEQSDITQSPSILLVEDDEDTAGAMSSLLTGLGAQVTCIASLVEAQRIYDDKRWEAVMIDLHLGSHSGFDLAKYIRSKEHEQGTDRTVYIALVSGASADSHLIDKFNVQKSLLKPVQVKDLKILMNEISLHSNV